jgi:hypothetical protein
VVIGGIAVLRLVPHRTTREVDVLIEPTLVDAVRVRLVAGGKAAGRPGEDRPDLVRLRQLAERRGRG